VIVPMLAFTPSDITLKAYNQSIHGIDCSLYTETKAGMGSGYNFYTRLIHRLLI
jgi:hypothetical protein